MTYSFVHLDIDFIYGYKHTQWLRDVTSKYYLFLSESVIQIVSYIMHIVSYSFQYSQDQRYIQVRRRLTGVMD